MEGKVKLTGEQAKELTDYVEQTAAERLRNGAMEHDTDFYCGAMVVIHYLAEGRSSPELTKHVPPIWVFGLMSGRSPTAKHMGDEEAQQRCQVALDRASRLVGDREQMYEFICYVFDGGDRCDSYDYTPGQTLNELRTIARLILEDIGIYDFWKEEEE